MTLATMSHTNTYIWASNVQQSVGAMSSHHISKWTLGFLSAFAQGEGMQVRICVQTMRQTRGSRGILPWEID